MDAVIAKAGVARMTLYRNFATKDALILDFLARREELWANQWLIGEIRQRATEPARELPAVFGFFSEAISA